MPTVPTYEKLLVVFSNIMILPGFIIILLILCFRGITSIPTINPTVVNDSNPDPSDVHNTTNKATPLGSTNNPTEPTITWQDIRDVCHFGMAECSNGMNKPHPGYRYACVSYSTYLMIWKTMVCSVCLHHSVLSSVQTHHCNVYCTQSIPDINQNFVEVCTAEVTTTPPPNPPPTQSPTQPLTPPTTPPPTIITSPSTSTSGPPPPTDDNQELRDKKTKEWAGVDTYSVLIGIGIMLPIALLTGFIIGWQILKRRNIRANNRRNSNADSAGTSETSAAQSLIHSKEDVVSQEDKNETSV